MKDPVVHEALRQIQDIVAGEFARPISTQARALIEKVLQSAFGQLARPAGRDSGLTREVTILLADLRGFTAMCNSYPANTVLALLNRCLVRMSEIAAITLLLASDTFPSMTGEDIVIDGGAIPSI